MPLSVNKDFTADVMQTMYQFAMKAKFTDFRIRTGNTTVYCHQAVVSSKSEYLRSICSSGMTEAVIGRSVMNEVDGQTLHALVKFLYLGITDIHVQNVNALLLAADFIKQNDLKRQCEIFMHPGMHRDHQYRDHPHTARNGYAASALATAGASIKHPTAHVTHPTLKGEEKMLVMGGFSAGNQHHKNIVLLDENGPASIIARTSSNDYSVCAEHHYIYFSGGVDFATATTTTQVKKFSLVNKSWTELPPLQQPLDCHGSACVDSQLYIIGGRYTENGHIKYRKAAVNALDLSSLSWSKCEPLETAVSEPGVVVVDKDILVIGGCTGHAWSTQTSKYSTRTGKWKRCHPMPKGDNIHRSTVVVMNHVFVMGVKAFMQYDVTKDTWSVLAIPMKPSHLSAMVLKEDHLIVLGGCEKDVVHPNDRIQTYNLSSKTWCMENWSLPLALSEHHALVVMMH